MAVVSTALGLLCVFVTSTWAAPARKTFDQRQQGDLNIHAQLDNIVVVVIPSARLNLLDLALDTKFSGEKGGFFQLLQKLQNAEIDRYDTIKEEETPQVNTSTEEVEIDIKKPFPVITSSQQVSLNQEENIEEKEEEVVATVEEMKPDPTKETTTPSKPEPTEDSIVKEQSTISEQVQESVPEEQKNSTKEAEKKVKESSPSENDTEKQLTSTLKQEVNAKTDGAGVKKETFEHLESPEKEARDPPTNEGSPTTYKSEVISTSSSKEDERTIEDYIKPVAAKEEITPTSTSKPSPVPEDLTVSSPKKNIEPMRLQEGVRKEKVIRYKPEAKWAPELVDLLGPPKPKPKELQERQMFADLCSPGVWDPELRTCIMPGETRSRNELARFLDAMRFGIAIPK